MLRDVREAVEDWEKMHAPGRWPSSTSSTTDPPPLPDEEVAQGSELLRWLADDHFTFLGYREYRLETRGRRRDAARGPRHRPRHPARRPGHVGVVRQAARRWSRPKAREKTLLVLAKANSRATVHRPAYLDYVGVKKFDENGEVVGERRFLGLFSSAAYTESLTRIPVLREKAAEVLAPVGFDPRSHAGKALMDILETYPRDELFQTPVDELAPIAEAVLHTRERRAAAAVRPPRHLRPLPLLLVYLPRDRYTTNVRERISAILKEQLGGESVEFTARVTESDDRQLHFVVHPPQGRARSRDVDIADLERRLAEAARSWRDDFATAVIERVRRGGGRPPGPRSTSTPSRRPTRRTSSPRTGAVDLGRLEAIDGDDEGIDLSLYEEIDAGRGEARLKVFRIGPPLSLSEVLPMLSSMGVEVVDERPYELEGLDRPSYIYEFGLRYGQTAARPARASCSRTRSRAVWDGYNEIDGFNALVLGAGLTWRQATVLRAYAKYMRQGGTAVRAGLHRGRAAQQRRHHPAAGAALRGPLRPGPDDLPADDEARVAEVDEVEDG